MMLGFVLAMVAALEWSSPVRISPDTLDDYLPAVLVDTMGNATACWHSDNRLWARYSLGDVWGLPRLVDTAACARPDVVTSSMCGSIGGLAWVAWTDSLGYIRLTGCGAESTGPTSERDPRIVGTNPAIVSDSYGAIWCVWTAPTFIEDIRYMVSRYAEHGPTVGWDDPTTLATFMPLDIYYTASITTDTSGRPWVAYNDLTIWARQRETAGWSSPESLGTCADAAFPTLCGSKDGLWAAWFESSPPNNRIPCRFWDGSQWSALYEFPHALDTTQGWQVENQDIVCDDEGRLWAVWTEVQAIRTPNYMICASSLEDGSRHGSGGNLKRIGVSCL